jgi:predicted nuclease of restriction endonuclease-like RecB superfamily
LLPDKLIAAHVRDGRVVPAFLDGEDLPWLRALVAEIGRFEGRPVRELADFLKEPFPAPFQKQRAAGWLIQRFWRPRVQAAVEPAVARAELFTEAARQPGRSQALATVAARLEIEVPALERALFADLPGERIVHAPADTPTPEQLASLTNLLVVRSLLARATEVRILVGDDLVPLLRVARQKGLICDLEPPATLTLSGPFALFRHTRLYGRALGDLLPALSACQSFELRAQCDFRGRAAELVLSSASPLFSGEPWPAPVDTVTARLKRDFARVSPDWDLTHHPPPVPVGDSLAFPDFLVRHRIETRRWFFVEILGFWTPECVTRLLARPLDSVLCIDETRQCGAGDPPSHPRLVRYQRRIDPAAILRAIDSAGAPA